MFMVRRANERGHFDHGWLDTYHTFSFGDYYDSSFMGFRSLRVINEDRIAPGQGFGMHGHRDMEIITCILEGALEHKDSMGHGSVIRPGEFQRMSAGRGIMHSEFNHSQQEMVHLYQIWLQPSAMGVAPSYDQRHFDFHHSENRLQLIASATGRDGSLLVHQDADLYHARICSGQSLSHRVNQTRALWLQVVRGSIATFDTDLQAGDGMAISEESSLLVHSVLDAEFLLFDLN